MIKSVYSSLGRFTQADTIAPAGVQGYDHYAAMENNPVRYADPTGHMVSDGLVGEGGGCDRQCLDERNKPKSPAPKPPRGGGGGSSDEATSPLGDVFGGSKGPGLNSPANDVIDSGGDSDVGFEIRSDGLTIIWYYGTTIAFDRNAGIDTATEDLLEAFIKVADRRKTEIQRLNEAQSDFWFKGVAAFGIAATTGLGYIGAASSVVGAPLAVPIAITGTVASAYAAYEVYKSGMAWGEASVNLNTIESNLQTSWNSLDK